MILLTLSGVSKTFQGVNEILKNVDLTLKEGARLGLVGVNGSGKSTLLRIIAGDLAPDSGSVSVPRGTQIGFLTQHADIESGGTVYEELARAFDPLKKIEARLRELELLMTQCTEHDATFEALGREYSRLTDRFDAEGGYEWPSRIQGVLAGLGFQAERANQPAAALSGGEKTRLCLARLLLIQPDLLLLDEPTNHLDISATLWLEDTLRKYRGTVIVISHDRYFLNSVCNHMAEVSMTRLTQYEGNYDAFSRQRQANLERQLKEFNMQQKEISRQRAIIERYRSYNREKSIRAAESREKMLDKIELVDRPVDEHKIRLSFQARRRTGEDVLMLDNLSKAFDGRTLFEHFSLHLRAGDRIAVIGPNGVGKTTLLRMLVNQLQPDTGTIRLGANVDIGYYDQQQENLHPEKTVMNELWDDFPRLEPDQVRSVLALFLFTGEDVFQPVGTLSGGERGRVALAKLMLKHDNLLILDEPTNHLDMDSREVLEGALEDFTGSILTVSHDRYFINRIANRVIEMNADGTVEYIGNYDAYLEKKRQGDGQGEPDKQTPTKTQLEKQKKKEKLAQRSERALQAQLKAIEDSIAAAEQASERLEASMGEAEVYQSSENAARVARELRETTALLESLYEDWADIAETIEGKLGGEA